MYLKLLSRSLFPVLTHIQAFEVPRSLERDSVVSTSDPSFKVEFLGPKQHNNRKNGRRNFSAHTKGRNGGELGHVVLSTVSEQDTGNGGEQLLCYVPHASDET